MQSAITRDKLSALILLAASTSFGVLANNLGGFFDRSDAASAPGRLYLAFALTGSLLAFLMLLSPEKGLRFSGAAFRTSLQRLIGLSLLVICYALSLETLGFLIATSLFLALGYLLLGERRWALVLMTSIAIAAILQVLMYGVFGAVIADPLLHLVGVTA